MHFFEDGVTDNSVSLVHMSDGGKLFMFENARFQPAEEGFETDLQGVKLKLPYKHIDEYRLVVLGKF